MHPHLSALLATERIGHIHAAAHRARLTHAARPTWPSLPARAHRRLRTAVPAIDADSSAR
jgi:hypothetical protein